MTSFIDPESSQITVSVTIATFNRKDLLREIIESLKLQTADPLDFEVIICDSYSSDGTSELIREYVNNCLFKIIHVHTTNNLAAKRNLGIRSSNNRLVVFLDDDCVPTKSLIEEYQKAFRRYGFGKRVAFCGEVRYPEQFVLKSNYYRFRDSRHFGFGDCGKKFDTLDYKTIVVMNMCFERDIFATTVGVVNEEFIGYGAEDQDLGWRMQEAGFTLIACPAKIIHYEMTGSISAYGSKIRRTARDGMKTLLRVNRPAALGIKSLRLIDSDFEDRDFLAALVTFCIRVIDVIGVAKLIEIFLQSTDARPSFYFPRLYRFMMAIYYVRGTLQRENSLSSIQAAEGWET